MVRDGQMVGSMVLCDRVREHASSTVKKLQDRGYHTAMLTGAPLPTAFTSTASVQALALDDCCDRAQASLLIFKVCAQGGLDLPCTMTRRREG